MAEVNLSMSDPDPDFVFPRASLARSAKNEMRHQSVEPAWLPRKNTTALKNECT